jgi:NAD+ kinase
MLSSQAVAAHLSRVLSDQYMSKHFSTIAIMGNHKDQRALDSVRSLLEHLDNLGLKVAVSDSLPTNALPDNTPQMTDDLLLDGADLLVAVGGDGTMLRAARHAALHGVPLLGINRGRLGFLADVSPEQMQESFEQILAGQFTKERRMLLRAEIYSGDAATADGLAMNDIVLKNRETGRMLEFQTIVDGQYVNTHGGDGFIAATPTGSTAYALSCGGPIVEPGMEAIVLAPICPHTLSDRPIVISSQTTIEVTLTQDDGTRGEVNADGEFVGELTAGEQLNIVAAEQKVDLLHPHGYDYFGTLRSKLYWGRDTRDRSRRPID